jgi:hypothetical protein
MTGERVDEISDIELAMLERAVEKLNFVYLNGNGESLTEDEAVVFNYWKNRGKVKEIGPARYGTIYAANFTED